MNQVVGLLYIHMLKLNNSVNGILKNPLGLSYNMSVSLDIAEFVTKYKVSK